MLFLVVSTLCLVGAPTCIREPDIHEGAAECVCVGVVVAAVVVFVPQLSRLYSGGTETVEESVGECMMS